MQGKKQHPASVCAPAGCKYCCFYFRLINALSVNILVKKRVIEAAVFDYQYILGAPKLYYKAGIDVTDFIEDLREELTRR